MGKLNVSRTSVIIGAVAVICVLLLLYASGVFEQLVTPSPAATSKPTATFGPTPTPGPTREPTPDGYSIKGRWVVVGDRIYADTSKIGGEPVNVFVNGKMKIDCSLKDNQGVLLLGTGQKVWLNESPDYWPLIRHGSCEGVVHPELMTLRP